MKFDKRSTIFPDNFATLILISSLIIGSKLDKDIAAKQCRLAFCGQIIQLVNDKKELYKLQITKEKMKKGKIDRVTDNINIIGKDLFKKETNPDIFVGKKVTLQP